jgi:hypothetical protein
MTREWRSLSRFQILVFDFEAYGSDYEHRARERARAVLVPDQASRSTALWPILGLEAEAFARAGGGADLAASWAPRISLSRYERHFGSMRWKRKP